MKNYDVKIIDKTKVSASQEDPKVIQVTEKGTGKHIAYFTHDDAGLKAYGYFAFGVLMCETNVAEVNKM